MSKGYFLNFEDSEEELFNWINTTPNADKLIKEFIKGQINKKSQKCTYTIEELNEIAEKARELFTDEKPKRIVGVNGEMSRYRK